MNLNYYKKIALNNDDLYLYLMKTSETYPLSEFMISGPTGVCLNN